MRAISRTVPRAAAVAALVSTGLFLWGSGQAWAFSAEAPLSPDRDQARTWAVEELLGREYHANEPSPWQRLVEWLFDQLDRALTNATESTASATITVIGLVVVLVGVSAYLMRRSGSLHRDPATPADQRLFSGPTRTAAEHRAAADAAEAAGDLRTAVLERFRGLIRGLTERALVDPQPGQTADEAARSGSRWLPERAEDLAAAARAFDDVRYGDRTATPATVTLLREVDDRVIRTRPGDQPVATAVGFQVPQ